MQPESLLYLNNLKGIKGKFSFPFMFSFYGINARLPHCHSETYFRHCAVGVQQRQERKGKSGRRAKEKGTETQRAKPPQPKPGNWCTHRKWRADEKKKKEMGSGPLTQLPSYETQDHTVDIFWNHPTHRERYIYIYIYIYLFIY